MLALFRPAAIRLAFAGLLAFPALPPASAQTAPATADAPKPPAAGEAIFWYPAPSRCTFFTPHERERFRFDDPDTWRFAFLVMRENGAADPAKATERGYVMNAGVLRELEKLRTGPDAAGDEVTVWRSAGEPRINVNVTLRTETASPEERSLRGRMVVIRGDGETATEIVGSCGP